MTQKRASDGQYPPIHYIEVNEFCYLSDINKDSEETEGQGHHSDREVFSSIADRLYKKIMKQGYIEKAKQFAVSQTKKKIEDKYDLSDKWINDEEAFTEPEAEKNGPSHFTEYNAISGVSIEEFYEARFKKGPVKSGGKRQKPILESQKQSLEDALKGNRMKVVKYDELKKKIQMNLKSLNSYKPQQKR